MWHNFDLFPQDLNPDAALVAMPPSENCRLVYEERLVRWMKPVKYGAPARYPVVERKPGLVIERRRTDAGRWRLQVRQERVHSCTEVREGEMVCESAGWRSPLEWRWTHWVDVDREEPRLSPLVENGSWDGRRVATEIRGRQRSVQKKWAASGLLGFYALLADYPREQPLDTFAGPTLWLDEDGGVLPATSQTAPRRGVRALAPAQGLEGRQINPGPGGGLPCEFWLGVGGAVAMVCVGTARALVLVQMEALS